MSYPKLPIINMSGQLKSSLHFINVYIQGYQGKDSFAQF